MLKLRTTDMAMEPASAIDSTAAKATATTETATAAVSRKGSIFTRELGLNALAVWSVADEWEDRTDALNEL